MTEYRAGIYLRLSREHSEENNSIEAQREITTNYDMKNNYRIVKEYADNGLSLIHILQEEMHKSKVIT